MKRQFNSLLKASLKTVWPQTLLLLVIVAIFSANAIGLLEFKNDLMPGIDFKTEIFQIGSSTFSIPAVATTAEFYILIFSGVLLSVCLPLLSPIGASVLVFVLALPPFLMALYLPYRPHSVPMQFNWLVLLITFGINVLMKYFAETQEKQKLLATFAQFVPPEIVNELSRQTKHLTLDGESKLLTVLFCDLRNFTGISEQLDPKDVVKILNEYFTIMTTILFKYGATIDKYIGDSIMAFWGAPLPQEDHVRRAVLASFEMHSEMHKLTEMFRVRGLPTPTIGVGINSGVMNVGNMGSRYRLAYTVIGDAVNLAFRFQGTTRDYQVSTIVGENTAHNFSDMVFRELDTVTVRGKTRVSRIYEPLCMKSELNEALVLRLELHQQALSAYYDDNHSLARELFTRLSRQYPDDGYYQCMLNKLSARSG